MNANKIGKLFTPNISLIQAMDQDIKNLKHHYSDIL